MAVAMATLPACDICTREGRTTTARYDAALKFGGWAYVCEDHFVMFGVGTGVGLGQELVLAGAAPTPALCTDGLTDEEHLCAVLMLGECPACGTSARGG